MEFTEQDEIDACIKWIKCATCNNQYAVSILKECPICCIKVCRETEDLINNIKQVASGLDNDNHRDLNISLQNILNNFEERKCKLNA